MAVLIVLSDAERLRFEQKIDKTESCWVWTGGSSDFGHGRFKVKGKLESTHRISYCLHKGEIASSLWVLHRCHNPRCVNPEHLYLGDRSRNTKDALESGRAKMPVNRFCFKDGNKTASKLSADSVREIRQKLLANADTVKFLAQQYDMSAKTIRSIRDGKAWADVA